MNEKHNTFCPDCGEKVYRRHSARGKIRYKHRESQHLDCDWWGTQPDGVELDMMTGVDPAVAAALKKKIVAARGGKITYVITSAQNATPCEPKAWASLLGYCKHNNAQLLVVPFRYRNPTSTWGARAQEDDWWTGDEKTGNVLPYLINQRVSLNKHLMLLADIMTQPTAMDPLEGFENISGAQSAIIGHPRLEMDTIPTPQSALPKILTTTGCITKKNYIPSKAGKKGEFHHTYGATVVEIDGPRFHMRQINMTRDGSFCDLLYEYSGDKRRKYDRVAALVMGDTHVEVIDPKVVKATFTAEDSIVKTLRPEHLVWHDVFDGASINHHERGRVFHEFVKFKSGRRSAEDEVRRTLDFIDQMTPEETKNVIVPSNHNDFLREWVENTDGRRDVQNIMFWAETVQAICGSKNTRWTPSGVAVQDAFAYWGEKLLKCAPRTVFLRRNQAFQILDVEVGYHGDRGPGGKPGSRESFSKIGVRSIIGHKHAPGIKAGAYQVGTSSHLDLTYAAGDPSAWLHTHCIIYPNGKRCLVNIIEGKWRPSA